MAQILVHYNPPADPAAFDKYYTQTHVPIAKKIPGLRSYVISKGPVEASGGSAPYLIAVLTFDTKAALDAALASPEGQAAAGDLANFATGGATLFFHDSQPA